MRNLMVKLVILSSFLLFVPVQAQAPIHLTSMSVDLWPEYDQPAVLVIYHIQLAQDTTLPVSLTLHIPAAAQVNAVAAEDSSKGLVNAPYQSTIQGDSSLLTITSNSLKVQVEYYFGLVKDGTTRHITYEWAGDNSVDTLDVNFLLPPAADQVKITPSPVSSAPGQGGLTNYLIRTANPPLGKKFTVTIDYQRQTDELSISSLPVQAISTPGANTPGLTSSLSTMQWVLGGLGVLLVVGGVFGFINWKRSGQGAMKNGNHDALASPEKESEVVYCSECGKRAQPGDVFCRTCGSRLRQNESSGPE